MERNSSNKNQGKMKNYIKPEAEVYKVGIESPLCESLGQLDQGDAKRHDYFLFDEEDGGWQPKDVNLWDDEDFEDGMKYSK